jgi:hypothetical protein
MRMKKEDMAKIDDARVRNMLKKLPEIRSQMAGYYDDLRKIEHDVYEFNQKFSLAIQAIYAVERFYPGEENNIEVKQKSKIIPFSYPERYEGPDYKRPIPGETHE